MASTLQRVVSGLSRNIARSKEISVSAWRRKGLHSSFPSCISSSYSTRVVVGMSGGVDSIIHVQAANITFGSTVAALLLKQQGFDVVGVHMKNWDAEDEMGARVCPAEEDWASVRASCDRLGIACERVELTREYWHRVFAPTLVELSAGRTPNPDVLCNRELKFDALLRLARDRFGCALVATGHYARLSPTRLLKAADSDKDQTYFLAALRPSLLPHIRFPVGELRKGQVRALAAQHGFDHVAARRSSAGICFIGRRHFPDFLRQYMEPRPGPIRVAPSGSPLGTHRGLFFHTIGQRLRLGGAAQPWMICGKDLSRNELWVCAGSSHPALQSRWFTVGPLQVVSEPLHNEVGGVLEGDGRVRHQQPLFRVRMQRIAPPVADVRADEGVCYRVEVLGEPQRAVAPGQAFVLYQADVCVGAGKILTTEAEVALAETMTRAARPAPPERGGLTHE